MEKEKDSEQIGVKVFFSNKNDGNMSFYAGKEREVSYENRKRFFQERSVDLSRAIFLQQTHSNHILVVGEGDAGRGSKSHTDALLGADAFITNIPGIALCVQVADCASVLLFDSVHRVTAAVHSGWRGTLQNIVGETVLKMNEVFGSEGRDIQAWIGPAIGGSCFIIDHRIADPVREKSFDGLSIEGTHWDIAMACRGQLIEKGLRREHIYMSGECTVCGKDIFFSYKREGDHAGRMLAGIVLL